MSGWKFKTVQKAHDFVTLHFNDTSHATWGDTMSVTIPQADAEKLLAKLQAELQNGPRDRPAGAA